MTINCMRLYLDEPCGWRPYLIVRVGRRWAHLLNLEDASTHKCAISFLLSGQPMQIKPTRVARRLRAVARTFDRANGRDHGAMVKEALRLLRGGLAGADGVKPPTQGLERPRSVR